MLKTLFVIRTKISLCYNLFPANGLLYVPPPPKADNLTPNSSRRKQNFNGIREMLICIGYQYLVHAPQMLWCMLNTFWDDNRFSLGIIHYSSSNAQLSCCKLLPLWGLMTTWWTKTSQICSNGSGNLAGHMPRYKKISHEGLWRYFGGFYHHRGLYPASIPLRATIGPPAKRHPDGFSLVGQYLPEFTCLLGTDLPWEAIGPKVSKLFSRSLPVHL